MPEISPTLATWLQRFARFERRPPMGPLEYGIVSALWTHGPLTVRQMHPYFPRAAYTTIMTTLDRLYKKGALVRVRVRHQYLYRAALTRLELHREIARGVVRAAMRAHQDAGDVAPLLAVLSSSESSDISIPAAMQPCWTSKPTT